MIDWQPILVATLAGLLLGAIVLGHIAAKPTYASEATPAEVGRIVAASGIVIGGVFFIGQAIVNRDLVGMMIDHFGSWVAYVLAIGLGCYLRLLVDEAQRNEAIQSTATREVEEESKEDKG